MCTPLNVLVFHLKYHAYNSMICHRHIITLHADCGLSVLRSEFVCRWLWWTVSDFACRLWAVSFMKWLSEDCGLPVSESDIADCGMPVSRSDFFCRLWAFSDFVCRLWAASFTKWLCLQIVGCQFHREPGGSTARFTEWANTLSPQQLYTQVSLLFSFFAYCSIINPLTAPTHNSSRLKGTRKDLWTEDVQGLSSIFSNLCILMQIFPQAKSSIITNIIFFCLPDAHTCMHSSEGINSCSWSPF